MEIFKNKKEQIYYNYNLWVLNGDYLNDIYDEEKNEYKYSVLEDNCFKVLVHKLMKILNVI